MDEVLEQLEALNSEFSRIFDYSPTNKLIATIRGKSPVLMEFSGNKKPENLN